MASLFNKSIKKGIKILLIVLGILIILRLFLPTIVLHYANKNLANVDGYYGHIEDIDISLYRGAYEINNMYLNKKEPKTGKQVDFFKAPNIDLSIQWSALFNGRLVGELEFNSPQLIFTKDKAELGNVKKDTNDFRKILKNFMPFKVNRFEVNNGTITYKDQSSSPNVNVSIKQAHIIAENLTNATRQKDALPANIVATGKAYEGTMNFNMKLDPLAQKTAFDMNAEIKNTNLVPLNNFLKAYGNFDVNKGRFGLYTEFASKNGHYKGYVKPIIKDLDVLGPEDRKDNVFRKLWEAAVGAVGNVLTNPKKEQIATKVPIEGDYKSSDTNILEAIWELLRNAFIQALMPSIDNQINLKSVETSDKTSKRNFFQKIFGKKKKKNKFILSIWYTLFKDS